MLSLHVKNYSIFFLVQLSFFLSFHLFIIFLFSSFKMIKKLKIKLFYQPNTVFFFFCWRGIIIIHKKNIIKALLDELNSFLSPFCARERPTKSIHLTKGDSPLPLSLSSGCYFESVVYGYLTHTQNAIVNWILTKIQFA